MALQYGFTTHWQTVITLGRTGGIFTCLGLAFAAPVYVLATIYTLVFVRKHRQSSSTPQQTKENRFSVVHSIAGAYQLFALTLVGVLVEKTLRRNNVSGVHSLASTGQFIPVVIGGGSLVLISYQLWKKLQRKHETEEDEQELGENPAGEAVNSNTADEQEH